MTPLFLGLSGPVLTDAERAFFRSADPAGYILFHRNCVDVAQLQALTDTLRALAGRDDLPILIDQEGGRVARLRAPEWPVFPAAGAFDLLYETGPVSAIEAMRANARAIATVLRDVGVTVDCLPLLDVRQPGAHDIIGDRAFGDEPLRVAALGRATLEGLRDGGVVGVVKHIPGHGRAMADSHRELPVVDADADALETDLAPFRTLSWAPMAMTAHVVYPAWDAAACASLSATVIGRVIRDGIGFDGLLMSDDLGMAALSGGYDARAAGVLAAGCDIALHCSGDIAEMEAIAGAAGAIGEPARARLDRAMATIGVTTDLVPLADLIAKRDALLALA